MTHAVELGLLLLFIVCVVAGLASRYRFSFPIALVMTGVALASVPGFPVFRIPPELMLLIFLPPLLTEAAFFTSFRDFRANLRPILQLAVGLVLITTFAVGAVAQAIIPEMTLVLGLVLGAIVSPPDAVAAAAVIRRAQVPKRVTTILEGESLVNDATGLVLYQFAVAAVVTGVFSLADASLKFSWMMLSGVLIGVLTGWVYMRLFPRIRERSVEILSSFLVPYVVYVFAEQVHSSGVLAVVTHGLVMGWMAPSVFRSAFRLPAEAVWQMAVFVLNGVVFLLIGLQFPAILKNLSDYSWLSLAFYALAVSLTAIVVRFVWVYALAYGVRYFIPALRKHDAYPPWQNVFIVAWTGMRGVVSLATALALPLTLADGSAFPLRDLIIFLACSVIFSTLILQGIPLSWLLKRLTLYYDPKIYYEDWLSRRQSAEAALSRLSELAVGTTVSRSILDRMYGHYRDRLVTLGDGPNTPLRLTEPPTPDMHPVILAESRVWRELLDAERRAVVELRRRFHISDDVMHDRLREIDLMYNRHSSEAAHG